MPAKAVALERLGYLDQMRTLGFERPLLDFDLSNPSGHTLRVFADPQRRELLVEMRLRRDLGTVPGMQMLRVEWLLLQNPRAQFSAAHPRLPGQAHPGLGMLRETMAAIPDNELSIRRYRKRAARYDESARYTMPLRRRTIALLERRPGQVVLDVGAGTGLSYEMLRAGVGEAGRVLAFEQSPEMFEQARTRVDRHAWRNVWHVNAPAETVQLPESVDAVLFNYVHDITGSVDLDLWPEAFDARAHSYTTIGNWKQKGHDVVSNGKTYHWSKHHEFLKFLELPRLRPRQSFHLFLNVDDEADRRLLLDHGFTLESPLERSLDPWLYQDLFRPSRAEWTVAKDHNVRLRSGWFSERDACYLASGKPVVAQSTGFEHVLPTGEGLFAFRTMDEVLAAVDRVESDYPKACRAARALAEEHFEATRVCRRFVEDLGL